MNFQFPKSNCKNRIGWMCSEKIMNLNASIDKVISEGFLEPLKIRKVQELAEKLKDEKYVRHAEVVEVDAGQGKAIIKIEMDEQAFREVCEEIMGAGNWHEKRLACYLFKKP